MGILNISKDTRDLIDAQLLQMAKICANMYRDTKEGDKIEARRQIRICLKEIKKLDLEFWEEICPDKKEKE